MQEYTKIEDSLKEKYQKEERSSRRYLNAVIILVMAVLLFLYFNQFVYFNVVVDGPSMATTLTDGDVLIADKTKTPKKGDIIIIDNEHHGWIIKRVIAVGGDNVLLSGGNVYLNGEKLDEPYALGITLANGEAVAEDIPFLIPEGEYFYLGDNRQVSADSRVFGTASSDEIVGVVTKWSFKTKDFRNKVFDFLGIDRGVN